MLATLWELAATPQSEAKEVDVECVDGSEPLCVGVDSTVDEGPLACTTREIDGI